MYELLVSPSKGLFVPATAVMLLIFEPAAVIQLAKAISRPSRYL